MKISPTRDMHPVEDESQAADIGKTMFEIYREHLPPWKVQVVYYTELPEKQHKDEIDKAFSGDSIYSGFLWDRDKIEAKAKIRDILDRLNEEEDVDESVIESELQPHLAN